MRAERGEVAVESAEAIPSSCQLHLVLLGGGAPDTTNSTARKRAEFNLIQGGFYEPCMFVTSLGAHTSFTALHEFRIRTIGFGFDFRFCERPQRSHCSESQSQREK